MFWDLQRLWRVLGLNQRRLSRRFYRPLPLTTRATRREPEACAPATCKIVPDAPAHPPPTGARSDDDRQQHRATAHRCRSRPVRPGRRTGGSGHPAPVFTRRPARAGLRPTPRSGRCTRTPPCSSVACAHCYCSRCTRWLWPRWPRIPAYQGDPWGRLQRTSAFLATTTFGTEADAQAMITRIRTVHERVHGTAPDGRALRRIRSASAALGPCRRGGQLPACLPALRHRPLDAAGQDAYVAQTARVAANSASSMRRARSRSWRAAGRRTGPNSLVRGRPGRRRGSSCCARRFRWCCARPTACSAASAVALLPRWARWPLRLPYLPLAEATVGRVAGQTACGAFASSWCPPDPAAPASAMFPTRS